MPGSAAGVPGLQYLSPLSGHLEPQASQRCPRAESDASSTAASTLAESSMILLPRSWRIGTVRAVVNAGAWLLVLVGLFGSYREACSQEGWGSFMLVWFGVILIALIAATEEGVTLQARALRLVFGLLMLPLSLLFIAVFQDFMRFACPA